MSFAALARKSESKTSGAHTSAKAPSGNLKIGEPDDAFEREADRVADEVTACGKEKLNWSLSRMSIGAPLQRKCGCGEVAGAEAECEECKAKKTLQRKTTRDATHENAGAAAPESVHSVLSGSGRPLDATTLSFMESRFGYDFGGVRIFDDDLAGISARAVAANAYTVEDKIVFNSGRYAPSSQSGRRLLAHELAHVVQQDGASPARVQRDSSDAQAIEDEPKSSSVLDQAFHAADAKHWEEAARLANGLKAYDLKIFLSQYKDPELISYLHKGALGAGLGEKSAIALATEDVYKQQKQKEELAYQRRLAKENGTAPPVEDGTPAVVAPTKPLTVQEKKQRCQSGETKGLMTFPLRMPHGMWRISVAPITAHRSGSDIIVSQPLNAVYGDKMFRSEVKTLPLTTFTGGVRIAPDDVVRVRVYDDNEKLICVTGEQMLGLSDATDTAMWLSVAGTVLDAASIMAPGVGSGASRAASAALGLGMIAANEGLEVARQSSAVNHGLQEEIHWGQIAFETLLQIVTLGVGGKLTEKALERVAGVAVGAYSRPALKLAVEATIQGGGAAFQGTARTLFDKFNHDGQKMTIGEFLEELALQFVQGALFHVVMSTVSHTDPHAVPEVGTAVKPPEHDVIPPPAEHAAAPSTHRESSAKPTPYGGGEHAPAAPREKSPAAAHEQTAPAKMEQETAKSPKALRKEDALATKKVETPEGAEPHEVIATKEGIGRCSEPPCPAIPVVYAKDLAADKDFKARYQRIRTLGVTDLEAAAGEAADLVRDIEMSRRNAAKVSNLGSEAPSNPDRGTSREEWKAQESKRREANAATNKAFEAAFDQATSPAVKGGRLEYTDAEGNTVSKKVPIKKKSRLDIDPTGEGDSPVPRRPGESGVDAAKRVYRVLGKTIADIPEIAKLWEKARAQAEAEMPLTETSWPKVRRALWALVAADTAEGEAARAVLADAGFKVTPGKATAPMLEEADATLRKAERRLSLDHKDEKAIGENWKKALDAENLQFEFQLPNSERENVQQRHPELRPKP
jgi:Domain of unknown function (DUF4157)/Putative RNase-like toxin, toxin_1